MADTSLASVPEMRPSATERCDAASKAAMKHWDDEQRDKPWPHPPDIYVQQHTISAIEQAYRDGCNATLAAQPSGPYQVEITRLRKRARECGGDGCPGCIKCWRFSWESGSEPERVQTQYSGEKPTIHELEEILGSQNHVVVIQPDGSLITTRVAKSAPPQPGDAERLADLLRRRADVYHPAREARPYYGDDDIDLLRSLLDTAQSALAAQSPAPQPLETELEQEGRLFDQNLEAQLDNFENALGLHGTPPQPGDAERLARLRQQRDDAPIRYNDGMALAPMVTFQWIDVDFLFQQLDAAQSALAEQQQIAKMRHNDWRAVTVQRDSAQSALAESQAEIARWKERHHRQKLDGQSSDDDYRKIETELAESQADVARMKEQIELTHRAGQVARERLARLRSPTATDFAADLAANQEPLGPEFEKVLHDNLTDLYARSYNEADKQLAESRAEVARWMADYKDTVTCLNNERAKFSELLAESQASASYLNDECARHIEGMSVLRNELAKSQTEVARLKEQMAGMLTLVKKERVPFIVNPRDYMTAVVSSSTFSSAAATGEDREVALNIVYKISEETGVLLERAGHAMSQWLTEVIAEIRAAARAQSERDGIEKAVQIALKYRDEADAGQHADIGNPEHSLGQGFAANSIAKRIRALTAPVTQEAHNG